MKTVQLLYSYLLVDKPFTLEEPPTVSTKENRFAYGLYLDLVYLIDRLAKTVPGKNHTLPLASSRFVVKTQNDDRIKALRSKYSEQPFPLESLIPVLSDEIKESLLFNAYQKAINKKQDEAGVQVEGMADDLDHFWENVFKSIILPNPRLGALLKDLPDYSLSGVEKMKPLMEDTFRNFYAYRDNLDDALKTLELSMKKARDLYMMILALPVELTKLRLQQLETNRRKIFATISDLNPNMRFVNNRIPALLEGNKDFSEYVEKNHISWQQEDPELLDLLLKAVLDSQVCKDYENLGSSDLKEDSQFWIDIMQEVILNNKDFLDYLETKSVFWNDDLEIMMSFAFNTIKKLSDPATSEKAVLPMYKDGEHGKDASFGAELFGYVVKNKETYMKYITDVLAQEKWSSDRLAFMDVLITMTALAEILNYPEIPLAVSVNEYVEIAKSYSSEKSGQFVHGLIASIIKKLQEDGAMIKR